MKFLVVTGLSSKSSTSMSPNGVRNWARGPAQTGRAAKRKRNQRKRLMIGYLIPKIGPIRKRVKHLLMLLVREMGQKHPLIFLTQFSFGLFLIYCMGAKVYVGSSCMNKDSSESYGPVRRRRRIPRSFKDLTPSNHFNPRTFFYEMVWKAWLTRRHGQHRCPVFPKLQQGHA